MLPFSVRIRAGRPLHAAAVLDLNAPPNVSESFFSRATIAKKQIAAPLHLSGVPSDYSVQSVGIRARLQMPDGAILESAERTSVGVRRPGERPSTRVTHIQGAIPQTRMLSAEDSGYEEWPVILAVNSRDYERYVGYLYEVDGFNVQYHGIQKIREDLGRDLICTSGDRVEIVDEPAQRPLHLVEGADGHHHAAEGEVAGEIDRRCHENRRHQREPAIA